MWDELLWVVALLTITSTYAQHFDDYMRELHMVNGSNAVVGQFAHQALLLVEDTFVCGGSLISEKTVLTAAHCILGGDKFTVRLGGVHKSEEEPTAWITVTFWSAVHHAYNPATRNNDVAVVFLIETPPLGRYIRPVELPSALDVENSFAGRRALVSGWGQTGFSAAQSEILQWTEVQVIDNDACRGYYKRGFIVESTLCAHDLHTGACYGDSGGALVLKTGATYKQIGIVSFGPSKCETHIPTAYVRVTSFLEWIATVPDT